MSGPSTGAPGVRMVAERGSPRVRRNVLLGCLAVLVGIALVWGGSLRDAADLARVRGAMASHDWPRAERLLRDRLPATGDMQRARRSDAERLFLLGRMRRRQHRFAEAEQCFGAASTAGWDAAEIDRQRLLARAQTGEIREVEEAIARSLESGVDDATAEECYEALAEGFIGAYRMREALECLGFWSRWQPANARPAYWAGTIEERYERPVLALEKYLEALALDPRMHEARVRAARLELDTGRLEDARGRFEACLAERPDEPEAVLGLADCLVRLGDLPAARTLYHDALTTDLLPSQAAAALTELGQMALGEGQVERGASLLAEAVAVDPRGTRARLSYAAALARVGDREGAERERAEAERLTASQRRLAQITHDLLGKPDDAMARAEAGAIFLAEGFEREGLAWLASALAIDPAHGPTHRVLADHHGARGDDDTAARHRALAGDAEPPGTGKTVGRGTTPAAAEQPREERP